MFGIKEVKFQNYLDSQLFYISDEKRVVINSVKVPKIKNYYMR